VLRSRALLLPRLLLFLVVQVRTLTLLLSGFALSSLVLVTEEQMEVLGYDKLASVITQF